MVDNKQADKQVPEWAVILKERWDRESRDWREQLLDELDVSTTTVWRWMQGKTGPDSKYKLTVLEKHVPEIAAALRRHFPSFYTSSQDLVLRTVAPVYARVHQALARTDASLILETVVSIVLYALINHLDVEQSGVVAFLGQLCSTANDGHADHLMIDAWSACGTGPWAEDQAHRSYSVGDDSLSALAVKTGRPAFYPRDAQIAVVADLCQRDIIQSAASYPILRSGKVAGVIWIASAQADYFVSHRREIIEQYALMIPLAFRDSDFYSRSHINLHPDDELQSFADYQHFIDTLKHAHPDATHAELLQRAHKQFRG